LRGARELLRTEAGAIDHRIKDDRLSTETSLPSARDLSEAINARVEGNNAAVILKIAAQRQHETMAVDNAGFRRAHRRDAGKLRLQPLRRGTIDDFDAFHPIDPRLLEDCFDAGDLALIRGDDELAVLAMGHAMGGAEIIEHAAAARAVIGA
jgi:hypothetical protein